MVITQTEIGTSDGLHRQDPGVAHSTSGISGPRGRPLGSDDDLELMTMPSVVGRESGERDPLLLRDKIVSDEAIKGLKQ